MRFEREYSDNSRRVTLEIDRAVDRAIAAVIVVAVAQLLGAPLLAIPMDVVELAETVLT